MAGKNDKQRQTHGKSTRNQGKKGHKRPASVANTTVVNLSSPTQEEIPATEQAIQPKKKSAQKAKGKPEKTKLTKKTAESKRQSVRVRLLTLEERMQALEDSVTAQLMDISHRVR